MTDEMRESAPGMARGAAWAAVPLPPDFDFAWALGFLSARAVPSLERMAPGEYWRSLHVDGEPLLLHIRTGRTRGGAPLLRVRTAPRQAPEASRRIVARMFDLDTDLTPFQALAAEDAILGAVVARRPWIRLPQLVDPFEALIRAVLGQQVSVAAASTMTDRLVARLGAPAPRLAGARFLTFPTPAAILAGGAHTLRDLGLTRAKTAAILAAAEAARDGRLPWDRLRAAPPGDVDAALTALPGIGPWTAAYLRMRALGDRDAFPASDLGVLKALRAADPDGRMPTPAQAIERAERWRPWRAYATLHLWESLGG